MWLGLNFKGLVPLSMVDWPGKACTTLFTGGCNYKCPACHNAPLVLHPEKLKTLSTEEALQIISGYDTYIDGVCITGGEPSLQLGLEDFCRELKHMDLKVKVDTNGFLPFQIINLLEQDLVDYVAVDIKAPLTQEAYSEITGTKVSIDTLVDLYTFIQYLINSDCDYEFRTTLVPEFHTVEDIHQICAYALKGAKRYVIQKFKASDNMIDPSLAKAKNFTDEELRYFSVEAKSYISGEVLIRNLDGA